MSKLDLRTYVVVLVQLALLSAAIHLLEIEQGGRLPAVMLLALGGFAVHALLPHRAKAPWFLLLSVGSIGLVLGTDALWLVGLGLGLFGLCHLPLNRAARGLLVLVAGIGLLLLRLGHWQTDWSARVIPVLASMFMFRVILYLQDDRAEDPDYTGWQRLSYFFMLPNVCFPLYPIVDHARYRQCYFRRPAAEIYHQGIHWMARGVLHLLLYRVVYHWVLPAPWEITDAASVLRFVVAGYALYLRISGQFHLIVGLLGLFGHDLPETHRNYFLASSFNDYWRRVNIYWKDFIEKVVFYPVFLRVRRARVPQPLVVAVLLTFVATWLLHSYQWFWLRGRFPVALPDVLFWGVLGVAVAANSVWESRRRRAPRAPDDFELRAALGLSLRTLAMFVLLSLLWSMWGSETVGRWWETMAQLRHAPAGLLFLLAFAVAAVGGGVAVQYLGSRDAVLRWRRRLAPGRNHAVSLGATLALFGFGLLPRTGAGPARLADALDVLAHERLNEQDQVAQVRGYYETLLTRQSVVGELWRTQVEEPPDWINIAESEFHEEIDGQVGYTLHPSMRGTLKNQPFRTNAHGLRDQEYSLSKPPRTYRIALLGSSYSMGSGVGDDEVYEVLVEERLNRDHAGGRYDRYEILNFAVGGYTHAHQVALYEQKVRAFEPDAVLLADHTSEGTRVVHHFAKRPFMMLTYPDPTVREIAETAGIYRGIGEQAAQAQLEPFRAPLTIALLDHLVADCRADGTIPAWLYVPLTRDDLGRREEILAIREEMARDAGMVVLSLDGAYGGRSQAELAVAPWDEHPRPSAMQLLADKLYEELLRADAELGMGLTR